MPLKIPPARLCSTARSKHGAENLRHFKDTSPLNEAANGYKPFRWDKVSACLISILFEYGRCFQGRNCRGREAK